MFRRCVIFWTLLSLGLFAASAGAQDRPGAEANATPPPGVDKFYFELSKSKDLAIKSMADRYMNLVKVQEWSDLNGKFKVVAHYVKHDANLSTVTIGVMKGKGTDRTTDEKTVPVDKLSKTCQSRVKQIDTMQKKLKELAAKPGPNGEPAMVIPENPGAPMVNEQGVNPGGPEGGAQPAAVAAPDPSASEPDPLGFAEVQIVPAGGPGATPPAGIDTGPGSVPPARPGTR